MLGMWGASMCLLLDHRWNPPIHSAWAKLSLVVTIHVLAQEGPIALPIVGGVPIGSPRTYQHGFLYPSPLSVFGGLWWKT